MKKLLGIWCCLLCLSSCGRDSGPSFGKADLSNVENRHEFVFGWKQKSAIARDYLLIYDAGLANPVTAYVETPIPFVTSDIMLHVYHVLASNSIEETERHLLQPLLADFVREALKAAEGRYKELSGEIRAGARKDLVLLGVAEALFHDRVLVPADVEDEVTSIVKSINQGGTVVFDGRQIDAVLAKARVAYEGDSDRGMSYTRADLADRRSRRTQYFRAVIWLRQAGLKLDDSQSLLAVALMAQIVRDNPAIRRTLQRYSEAVRFLAGKEDGLALDETLDIAQQTLGEKYKAQDLTADQLNAFGGALRAKSSIRILDRAEGVEVTAAEAPKLFFVLPGCYDLTGDLFQSILEQNRFPSGLDYAAIVLDSSEARRLSGKAPTAKAAREMAESLRKRPEEEWYETFDGGVQYALRTLVAPIPETHPKFMRTDAWAKKSLNTALGGWVQLSHDLFLYKKHADYAGDGGGRWLGFSGYVEPNPEFFRRLAQSVARLRAWLKKEGMFETLQQRAGQRWYERMTNPLEEWHGGEQSTVLPVLHATDRHYETLQELLETFAELSRKELEFKPFAEEEHEVLKKFGETLRWLTFDIGADHHPRESKPLICDVATERWVMKKCLQIAVGRPFMIVVVVPWGEKQCLAKGTIFSYYEFLQPMGRRLTDEDWKKSAPRSRDSWLGEQGLLSAPLEEVHPARRHPPRR